MFIFIMGHQMVAVVVSTLPSIAGIACAFALRQPGARCQQRHVTNNKQGDKRMPISCLLAKSKYEKREKILKNQKKKSELSLCQTTSIIIDYEIFFITKAKLFYCCPPQRVLFVLSNHLDLMKRPLLPLIDIWLPRFFLFASASSLPSCCDLLDLFNEL